MNEPMISEQNIEGVFREFEQSFPYSDDNNLQIQTYNWVIELHRQYYNVYPDDYTVSQYYSYIQTLRKHPPPGPYYDQPIHYENIKPPKKGLSTKKLVIIIFSISMFIICIIVDFHLWENKPGYNNDPIIITFDDHPNKFCNTSSKDRISYCARVDSVKQSGKNVGLPANAVKIYVCNNTRIVIPMSPLDGAIPGYIAGGNTLNVTYTSIYFNKQFAAESRFIFTFTHYLISGTHFKTIIIYGGMEIGNCTLDIN